MNFQKLLDDLIDSMLDNLWVEGFLVFLFGIAISLIMGAAIWFVFFR